MLAMAVFPRQGDGTGNKPQRTDYWPTLQPSLRSASIFHFRKFVELTKDSKAAAVKAMEGGYERLERAGMMALDLRDKSTIAWSHKAK